jgi:hypothetical protein
MKYRQGIIKKLYMYSEQYLLKNKVEYIHNYNRTF